MSNWTNDNDQPKQECSEPHNRRKRCRTSETADFRQQISMNPENLGLRHETQSPKKGSNPVDFSCNCHIHGYGQNNSLPKSQFKEPSNLVNYDQNQRQIISVRNSGDDDEATNFDHFITELDEALSRIESLIPSLQQMVCSNQPTNHGSHVGVSTLVDLSRLNPLPERDEIKFSNMISSRSMIDEPLNCVSTQSRLPTSHFSNLESEKDLPGRRNQIRETKNRAGMEKVEAVKYTLCRNDSVRSQVPDHIQGLQKMPCLFKNDDMNQNRMMYKESNVKNAALEPQGRDPFIGSANFVRPNRISSLSHSDYELSRCLTKGSASLERSINEQWK